jgi:5'-nucleotidase
MTTASLSRIQVYGGHVIDPLDPDPADIFITDIAHSLSNQCRFAGHVSTFYSVAEHSLRVSDIVPVEFKLDALMHDASETYLVDVPSPLKQALFGEQYREVEGRLMNVIAEKYGFNPEMPQAVRHADAVLLCTEARDLLGASPEQELWGPWLTEQALSQKIEPYSPSEAKKQFLHMFHLYTKGEFHGRL